MTTQTTPEPVTLTPIAWIRSCYPDRFGIPRQAGLVPSAYAEIVFATTEASRLALRGIDSFSHLWVLFLFHQQTFPTVKPLVHPPRLGGKKTMGVYATRSPNRLNPIGLSAVQLHQVRESANELILDVRGGDFLDGTPVLDIKPYIPYADAIPTAQSTWVTPPESGLSVHWSEAAEQMFIRLQGPSDSLIRCLINETLAQDPRPAYERGKDGKVGQQWNIQICTLSIFWQVRDNTAVITRILQSSQDPLCQESL